jgi:hypothetical protein
MPASRWTSDRQAGMERMSSAKCVSGRTCRSSSFRRATAKPRRSRHSIQIKVRSAAHPRLRPGRSCGQGRSRLAPNPGLRPISRPPSQVPLGSGSSLRSTRNTRYRGGLLGLARVELSATGPAPAFLAHPSFSLPPLECCFAASPMQGEKSWPDPKEKAAFTLLNRRGPPQPARRDVSPTDQRK